MHVQNTVNQTVLLYVTYLFILRLHVCGIEEHGIMITMLGLFIVVTKVEQRLLVLPNTAGNKELYGSNTCLP